MKKKKRIVGLVLLGCFTLAGSAWAGSGQASTVSITYDQTYATGTTVPMYQNVTVSGYVNPALSGNSVYYDLFKGSSKYGSSQAQKGFNGTLYTVNVPTGDYHLDLNPSGANFNSVVASGRAQN